MRIAVDSSVLLDVLTNDSSFGLTSREALRRAHDSGTLVACDVVWSEVRANFNDEDTFRASIATLGVIFEPLQQEASELAGALWRIYSMTTPRRERAPFALPSEINPSRLWRRSRRRQLLPE